MADISITAANVLASAAVTGVNTRTTGIAGATITAGQLLYIDTGDSNKLKLADADGTALAQVPVGIALHGAASGQPVTYASLDSAFTFGGTVAIGDTIYMSDTPGGLTIYGPNHSAPELETGDVIAVIGVAVTTTTMKLKIVIGGTRA